MTAPAEPLTHKHCSFCNQTKLLSAFHKKPGNKWGVHSRCKICRGIQIASPAYKAVRKAHRNRPEQKIKARQQEIFRLYGLTPSAYLLLLQQQDYRCAICKKGEWQTKLCVDHDHSTGKVRGILCSNCNTAIGLLGDKPKNLKSAKSYLEKFEIPKKSKSNLGI